MAKAQRNLLAPGLGLVGAFIVTVACSSGTKMTPGASPSTDRALEFALAVASGDAVRAHGMLASKLQSAMTAEGLAAQYGEMVAYGTGAPTIVKVMTTMDTWPDKQPGDLEWVYVAIANDTYSEAVTVVVAQEQSRLVIRSVEWGRP